MQVGPWFRVQGSMTVFIGAVKTLCANEAVTQDVIHLSRSEWSRFSCSPCSEGGHLLLLCISRACEAMNVGS